MRHDTIAVVDFGGQYAHLIATKVRRHNVLAEIRQPEDPLEDFMGCRGIILSGSPSLASQGEDSGYNKAIYDLPIPILGFCFGHQEIAKHYGGSVRHGKQEWGRARMTIVREHPLFAGLEREQQVWMSHFDSVDGIGPDFTELGYSVLDAGGDEHRFAAIASDKLRRYGFQYHPEVDDTTHGDDMIGNFVLNICECNPTWTMDNYVDEQIAAIRERVGDGSVFLLASGGVDSTVAAVLFGKALEPARLSLLHVDNGLMRKGESAKVLESFNRMGLGENLHFIDASEDFLRDMAGMVEPEEKRRAIGTTFVTVFEKEARRLGIEGHLLGQGTIYPDTIETGGTKRADTIKTHHNRVPVIEEMIQAGKVIEPLSDLYKVEVRELGEKLGIPRDMIWRHPFPGPGLGVRLLCSTGDGNDDGLAEMTPELNRIVGEFGLAASPLPLKSVGVKADLRSYEHPVLLTGKADWDTLDTASGAVLKSVTGINRSLWWLGEGTPTSFRPLAATMTRDRLDLLREADALMMEGLRRHGLYQEIWQCPTVLVPLEVDGKGAELCILRPIHSERAMTATAARLPLALVAELQEQIQALPGISGVAYDLTSKPPGTIEWE
ncbi:MAG: glutamine-hydrolyzing GMP synthase [bacterium]|nr:glutamine-hydrolyzing GMP synthase [bacterium]